MVEPSHEELSRYWKTVLDTVQDALMIMSPTGQILTVNRAAEEITGYTSAELLGRSCTVLDCTGCELYAKGAGAKWCSLFSAGKVLAKRCLITTKAGKRIAVIKRASVLKDEEGQLMGAVETLADISEMVRQEEEIVSLRHSLSQEEGFHGLLGHATVMHRLFELIENAARSEAPVLITGETGVGKELVAKAIHKLSVRAEKPFISVNCAALNENLLESELFGHVRGAFTGANADRVGRFEATRGGDIFMDEIGDVPLPLQTKLLRVLESKTIERVGDHSPIGVDFRLITATNRDPRFLLEKGEFREDLYYRINVIPIQVPALRERREDIPLLCQSFVEDLRRKTGRPIEGFLPQAMSRLYDHDWPGNVRELRNAVEYAFVLCREGLIDLAHLPERISGTRPRTGPNGKENGQRELLIQVLKETGGNQSEAARRLGVSRMTIYNRIKRLGINIDKEPS